MNGPSKKEDARNVSLITGSGLLALLITAGFVAGDAMTRHDVVVMPLVKVRATVVQPSVFSGNDRLYGHVLTDQGLYQGFIRWDRNEGSWTDLLDATKGDRQSGIRFGHIRRIEVTGRQSALFTLKSGEEMELGARATDLGSGLRALIIQDPAHGTVKFEWSDLKVIEFEEAPADLRAPEARLFGTMTTRSGLEFTGHLAWDVDEIYTSDILDGNDGQRDRKIRFGRIASIERESSRAARVVLHDGEEMILRGTNDVNRSNGGISISDPELGQVKVSWEDFGSVHFSEPAGQSGGYDEFDGGERLRGTVLTEGGEELSGEIRWDRDEAFGWEMLNGEYRGVEFAIEFGKIARIVRTSRGAAVTLRDGRVFELTGSNDVDRSNNGIEIQADGKIWRVDWSDFVELRLDH